MTVTATPELIHLNPNEIDIKDNVASIRAWTATSWPPSRSTESWFPCWPCASTGRTSRSSAKGSGASRRLVRSGLSTVPVYVRTVDGTETAVRAQRVIEQIVTNDHRAPLTEAERARGINQLLLDGVSPTKVAKGLSTTKDAVTAAKVAIDVRTRP